MAPIEDPDSTRPPHGLVDADRFLSLTRRLREVHERVEQLRVSAEQKARWQRRLVTITDVATRDLGRAEQQLTHLVAQLDRLPRRD